MKESGWVGTVQVLLHLPIRTYQCGIQGYQAINSALIRILFLRISSRKMAPLTALSIEWKMPVTAANAWDPNENQVQLE